jgi:hypothetical protein
VDFILDIYLEKKAKRMNSNLGDSLIVKYLEWLKDKDR